MAAGLTPSADELVGRVSGAVLAAIRTASGRTQEELAEQLRVGLSTVQAWESGRRPLIRVSFQDLQRLHRQLARNGTAPGLLHVLDQALLADSIYNDIAGDTTDGRAGGAVAGAVGDHPLSLVVPDRALTELLAWPLAGPTPRRLPVTARLPVAQGVRDAVAADLRAAADRAVAGERSAMLRRQVKFLVAGNAASRDWLSERAAADIRAQPDLRSWSPHWALARSQAVTSALEGDPEPLRRFIRHGLRDDAGIEANLNYWAYWVGEHTAPWSADADMTRPTEPWSGQRLLDSLLDGAVHAPYRELCAHALWSLLRHRRHLLRDPRAAARVAAAATRALETTESNTAGSNTGQSNTGQSSVVELDADAARRLEQVRYLAESAG